MHGSFDWFCLVFTVDKISAWFFNFSWVSTRKKFHDKFIKKNNVKKVIKIKEVLIHGKEKGKKEGEEESKAKEEGQEES